MRGGGMIGPSGNVRVYLACGVTDMRRELMDCRRWSRRLSRRRQVPARSSASAENGPIGSNFYGGMAKGSACFTSFLERGYFPWPTAKEGVAHLTQAQLSMLVEGIDWRRPARTSAPGRTG
ncbi:insertion sequence transposase [Rhizobium sp. CCGE 510]|nr:insertion sequence transposase [Rhizobium sp. CCGE 510]